MQLFRTYYSGLHRYALNILQDAIQADEAMQEVFSRLWEKRKQLNIDTSLEPYLVPVFNYRMEF